MSKNAKIVLSVICIVIVANIFIFSLAGLLGNLEYVLDKTALTVHTKIWKDSTINYTNIQSIEIIDDIQTGTRKNGYGDGKYKIGYFNNDLFGDYLLYSYTSSEEYVVLHLKNNHIVVLSDIDPASTKALYNHIFKKLS